MVLQKAYEKLDCLHLCGAQGRLCTASQGATGSDDSPSGDDTAKFPLKS